jgi:tetratricopeptide (TPR) repeat protein
MQLIRKMLAGWYAGAGATKFAKQKYEEAARLFEKFLRLDPNSGRTEMTYSFLGRCYLALGQMDKALHNFSVAYEMYQKNISAVLSEFERTQYKEFLKAYSYALMKAGQLDHSQEIARKAKDLMEKENG